jgi:hypothetical protein
MHIKWEEMKVGVRREISEEVERRVALLNQQIKSELMRVKIRVREIINEVGPLKEDTQALSQRIERVCHLAKTALSAGGATETRMIDLKKIVQSSPWGQDPSHSSHPSQLQKKTSNKEGQHIEPA